MLYFDTGKRNPPQHKYTFCNQELDGVSSHPYLGVHISNTLSWNTHVQEVLKKAQRVQNIIRRNFWSCDKKVKATAYLALVRPLLEWPKTTISAQLDKNRVASVSALLLNKLSFSKMFLHFYVMPRNI